MSSDKRNGSRTETERVTEVLTRDILFTAVRAAEFFHLDTSVRRQIKTAMRNVQYRTNKREGTIHLFFSEGEAMAFFASALKA